jgi:Predicted transcriptional regulators
MPDETMRSIIDRIKMRRLELEYSFQDLADLTGMSKSTLQRYETGGIKNIPLDKLKILAKSLNVSPEWIMGWDLPQNQQNTDTDNTGITDYYEYYPDEETTKKVLEIYQDKDARILLDAKRDLKKEDLDYIVGLIKRLKESR